MAITFTNFMSGDPVPAWGSGFLVTGQSIAETESSSWASDAKRYYVKYLINNSYAVFYIEVYFQSPAAIMNFADLADQTAYFDGAHAGATGTGEILQNAAYVGTWSISGGQLFQRGDPWTTSNLSVRDTSTAVHVVDATVQFTFDGTPYDPTDRDERIFAKEYGEYAVNVGVAVNESSSYSDYIYSTRMYTVVLRWTSPVTNESYSYNVDGLTWYIPTHTTDGDNNYFLYTKSAGGVGRALRMPIGKYAAADIPTNYSDLTDLRSIVTITLSQLVDYMATVRAGESEQSVFTVISADFMIGTDLRKQKPVTIVYCSAMI